MALLALSLAGNAAADDSVPTPWNGMDIGALSPPGTAKADTGTWTLTGGGEIAGAADRFHFVYQSLTGDCALVAHVSTDAGSAGIMARQALATNSDYAAVLVTPGHAAASTYRTSYAPRTASESAAGASQTWLKLVKRGTVVQSYAAVDRAGTAGAWMPVGGPHPIPSGMIYVGLCQAGGAATFDHVSLLTGSQPALDDGTYVISPSGAPGMALTVSGTGVSLAPASGAARQTWRVVNKGGFYSLRTLSTPPLVFCVPSLKSDSGTRVAVAPDGGQAQRWSIVANPNGTYGLLPQYDGSIGLDDFGGNTTPEAVIDVWRYDSNDSHLQWLINPAP